MLNTSSAPPTANSSSAWCANNRHWTQTQKEIPQTIWGGPVVCNVVHPTLTVVRRDLGAANGTAVLICPGGGFFLLSINSEGMDVARWLVQKGVTCFVLQ